MSFAVSSSPAGDILDEGLGSALPVAEAGAQPIYTYNFTSMKATATPGTIYWHASFSSATLTPCIGLSARVLQTTTRTLNVLPAPPSSTPQPEPSPSIEPPELQASIASSGGFHLEHPIVAFRVRCSTTCSGHAYLQALALGPHAKRQLASKLDFGPVSLAIPSASGGSELFAHRYRGRSLRVLDRLLRAGDVLEIRLTARVAAVSGAVAVAHSTARLRS